MLYELFSNKNAATLVEGLPVLVAGNKSELPGARLEKTLREDIERQIERTRASRAATLEDEDAGGTYLGVEGEAFKLSDLPADVRVCSCSVRDGEIGSITAFLEQVVLRRGSRE
eukprot:GHVU01025463.1.p3 GENE.GHVU01025463.1~~GHVU01025463.1.p3  ORF type:complete len:114 (+),score=22.26 GHVU01025463.1:1081-1422(+)